MNLNLWKPAAVVVLQLSAATCAMADESTAAAAAAERAVKEANAELQLLPENLVPAENWQVKLVTAMFVPRLGDVRNISESFNLEGRIYAHATMTTRPGKHAGRPFVEFHWYNGEKLISIRKASPLVAESPYYLATSTSGTALGTGPCRVELHTNGKLVASASFSVSQK